MKPANKASEIDRIVATIDRAVAEQRLPPGTRLVEAQLVESLNANRNHVRVALQRLALKRIVSIEPNKGASIAQPSVEEARAVFAARSVIERGIIEILVSRRGALNLALLRKQRDQEQAAIERGQREAIIRESGQFHLLLARLAGNPVLEDVLKDLITRSSLIISLYQRHSDPQCGCDEHGDIITAIESRDPQPAIQCMRHHLNDLEQHLNLDFWETRSVDLRAALSPVDPTEL
ncbi:GntR family transcriptional regulator [Saccharospirillum sp. HFRX-1]|uniref:GntR family transcriptional regulator n=1 Tax=unclassified Saccharospirillum TaxID=2633430 RepID=UPI00371A0B06